MANTVIDRSTGTNSSTSAMRLQNASLDNVNDISITHRDQMPCDTYSTGLAHGCVRTCLLWMRQADSCMQ